MSDTGIVNWGVRYQDWEPTMHLMFVDGILHQGWHVKSYEDCKCVGIELKWKPVPSEPAQPVEEK